MILVDSSVWIDYFSGTYNPQTTTLDSLLGVEPIAIGKEVLLSLTIFDMLGQKNAIATAENYRTLRKKGITVRKTIDCMISTFCIENNHALLFSDKDYQPLVEHLGLRAVSE